MALLVLTALIGNQRGATHKAPEPLIALLREAVMGPLQSVAVGPALTRRFGSIKAGFPSQQVWVVAKAGADKNPRYVTVEGYESGINPSASVARVAMFDSKGNTVNHAVFSTGWRVAQVGARVLPLWEIEPIAIEIQVTPTSASRVVAREFVGFIGASPVLLRLEAPDGKAIPNHFEPSNWIIGPLLPRREVGEWAKRLTSPNPNVALEALMWTTAVTWLGTRDEERTRFLERKDVQSSLGTLRASRYRWIREQAEMALKPPTKD